MSAMDHGRKGGDKGGTCRKLKISHVEPADKSKLKPEGQFTFCVSGVNDLDWVEATAKKLPVKLTHKLVTDYYLFTGTTIYASAKKASPIRRSLSIY
jgi:hypothetical protein